MLDTTFWKGYFRDYDILNELASYQEVLVSLVDAVRPMAADSILDLGAGTGNLEKYLQKERPARMVCFDLSAEGLAIAKQKMPWVETVQGDMLKPLPFRDGEFDVLLSNNALYTLPRAERRAVLAEMFRVVRPGGRVAISNILTHFSPFAIYFDQLIKGIRIDGIAATARKVIHLFPATMRMFGYNKQIKREHASGGYDFFEKGEQTRALEAVGFVAERTKSSYAGQAELVIARKP